METIHEGERYKRVSHYHGMDLSDVFEVIAVTRDGKYVMVRLVGGHQRFAIGTDVIREHYKKVK